MNNDVLRGTVAAVKSDNNKFYTSMLCVLAFYSDKNNTYDIRSNNRAIELSSVCRALHAKLLDHMDDDIIEIKERLK